MKGTEKKNYTYEEIKQKLVNYCVYQDRCHYEVEKKMQEFVLIPEAREEILLYLIQENFLNEERFARSFARGKFYIKKWGKQKIKNGLMQKGVSERLIQKSFEEIDPKDYEDTLQELVKKNVSSYRGINAYQKKQKTLQFLRSRGYEYELILNVLNDQDEVF